MTLVMANSSFGAHAWRAGVVTVLADELLGAP
jgi:hypothetical protein